MKTKLITVVATLAMAASLAQAESLENFRDGRYVLRVENQSKYAIDHLYIVPVSSTNWGQDYRANFGPMVTGRNHEHRAEPAMYAVKFVDQDGDVCDIKVDLRYGNRTVTINNRALLDCEGF